MKNFGLSKYLIAFAFFIFLFSVNSDKAYAITSVKVTTFDQLNDMGVKYNEKTNIQIGNDGCLYTMTYNHKAPSTSSHRYKSIGWKFTEAPLQLVNAATGESVNTKVSTKGYYKVEGYNYIDCPVDKDYKYSIHIIEKEEFLKYVGMINSEWQEEIRQIGGHVMFDAIMTYGVIETDYKDECTVEEDGKGGLKYSSSRWYNTYEGIVGVAPWGSSTRTNLHNFFDRILKIPPDPKSMAGNTSSVETFVQTIGYNEAVAILQGASTVFDAGQAMPAGEKIKLSITAPKLYGTVKYKVHKATSYFKVTTNLQLIMKRNGRYLGSENTDKIVQFVPREYTYITIESIDIKGYDSVTLKSDVFYFINEKIQKSGINITSKLGDTALEITLKDTPVLIKKTNQIESIVKSPENKEYTYKPYTLKPTADMPAENKVSMAVLKSELANYASTLAQYVVKSDVLEINSKQLLNEGSTKFGDFTALKQTYTFSTQITIPEQTTNGEKNPSVAIKYGKYNSTAKGESTVSESIARKFDKLVIHTPVVCSPSIVGIDLSKDEMEIGKQYTVQFNKIKHSAMKGYDSAALYSAYVKEKIVRFNQDILVNNKLVKASTWTVISGDSFSISIPDSVTDNKNLILEFRVAAKNFDGLVVLKPETESYKTTNARTESTANTNISKYVASAKLNVAVKEKKKIGDFNIYDINDYPRWESVFRITNSTSPTGKLYRAGLYDVEGNTVLRDTRYTLPLLNGSHPTIANEGSVRLGYTFRYSLKTYGNLNHEKDYVEITPKYYYVSKDGRNKQEVELYYNETIQGKKQRFIKVGSSMDASNIHAMQLGNVYANVSSAEFKNTSSITGKSINAIKYDKVPSYSYSKITLPSSLRTFVGKAGEVAEEQKWYGEFKLPADTFVAPKGYDVEGAARLSGGLTGKESFWLNDGYIVINFDIIAYKYNPSTKKCEKYLQYNDTSAGSNVWKTEGYALTKVDSSNVTFKLNYGDIIFMPTLYDGNNKKQNMTNDYDSAGTH